MIYLCRHGDTDAPRLSGTAGDLANLLDKLLVDGYNVKTITITRSGATATANCTSHGFLGHQTVKISGADQTDYNGEFRITVTDANNFTFTVGGSPATPATGTITAKVAPLGWTIEQTGTNIRSYKQKAGTNQYILGLDDTPAQNSRVRGFETMSAAGVAVASGTNPFPNDTQFNGGLYAQKSDAASTAARYWRFYSNGKIFHLVWRLPTGSDTLSLNSGYQVLTFGDITSYKPGDACHTTLRAANATNDTSVPNHWSAASTNTYMARWADQTTVSHAAGFRMSSAFGGPTALGRGTYLPYPLPIKGGLAIARCHIDAGTLTTTDVRGHLPGIWNPLTAGALTHLDTFSGATGSQLEGRTFEYHQIQSTNGLYGAFETSDTWD